MAIYSDLYLMWVLGFVISCSELIPVLLGMSLRMLSGFYSAVASDFKICVNFVIALVTEVSRMNRDSKHSSRVLRLACCVFLGLVGIRVMSYLSNRQA